MTYKYATVSEFIEAANDELSMERRAVAPRVQRAEIWHAIVSFPGCLGDNHSIGRQRNNVIESVSYWLSDDEKRGWRKVLRVHGIYYTCDGRVVTLEKHAIGNLF